MASDVSAFATQIIALGGVLAGAAATLAGQWINARSARTKDAEQRIRDARNELKAVVMRFLDTTQRVEQSLDTARDDIKGGPQPSDDELHAMWLAVKEVIISCSPELGRAANAYSDALQAQARKRVTDRSPKRIARGVFLDAARVELGLEKYLTE